MIDRYDMTDMVALKHILKVRVTRSCSYIQLDQSVYSQKVLDTCSAHLGTETNIRKCPLPCDTMNRIAKEPKECSEEDHRYVDNFPYRSMLDALLYLSMNTRPNISYAVGLLSRFGSKPTKVTCMLMVYLLQYIRGTVQMDIRFSGSRFDMHVFTACITKGPSISKLSSTGLESTWTGRRASNSHSNPCEDCGSISRYFYQGLNWTGLREPQKEGPGTAEEGVSFSY